MGEVSRAASGAKRAAQRNATLDLMRGLAALTVAVDHFSRYLGITFIHHGYLAVDFFFVLSGTVIAAAYADRIGRSLSVAAFLRRRVLRLYPLFAVGMLLGLLGFAGHLLLHGSAGEPIGEIAASIVPNSLVLPALTSLPVVFPLNDPMWSLSFEFIVNLLFAVWLVRLEVEELALFVVVAAVAMLWTVHHYATLNVGWSLATLPGGAIRSLFGFSAGMLLARLARSSSRRRHAGAILLCVLLVAGLVSGFGDAWRPTIDLAGALIVIPGLVATAMIFDLPERFQAMAAGAGDLAFPLYCSHYPLMAAVWLVAKAVGLSAWVSIMLFAPLSLGLAWVLLNGFDRPARRWLADRFDRRAAFGDTGVPTTR